MSRPTEDFGIGPDTDLKEESLKWDGSIATHGIT